MSTTQGMTPDHALPTSTDGWTVSLVALPDSLESPAAELFLGACDVQHAAESTTWGHGDLFLPAEMRLAIMRDASSTERLALVATRAGLEGGPRRDDVVGAAFLAMELTGNTHLATFDVNVRPDSLRSGIGTALADAVESLATEHGRTTLVLDIGHAGEPPADAEGVVTPPTGAGRIAGDAAGVAFARGRGYTLEQGERYSVLHLPLADDGVVDRYLAESVVAAGPDYEAVTWYDSCPDDLVEQYAALRTLMSTAAPVAGLDVVEHVWSVEEVRQTEQTVRESGNDVMTTAVRHRPSGELVGYSEIQMPSSYGFLAFQDDTLVAPAHRGHRLGMLMKTRNLVALRTLRPRLERLHTWNAEENQHMLSINEALGFVPTGVVALWQKRLT
jgi:GNAT superfamily N-acetyltransferase